jgi:hypothetical protein
MDTELNFRIKADASPIISASQQAGTALDGIGKKAVDTSATGKQASDSFASSIDSLGKSAQSALSKFEEQQSVINKLTASFDNALNPTIEFGEKLRLLGNEGRSETDILKVMGAEASKFADIAKANGQAVEPLTRKYADLYQETQKGGSGFESFGKAITEFARHPLESAKEGIVSLLEKMGPTAVGIGGVATAIGAAGLALFKMVDDLSDTAEQLDNLSKITGMSTQDLQALQQVAKEAGLEGMDLGRSIAYLNQQLGKPEGKEFELKLKAIGIATTDVSGKQKDAIQILDELRIALLGANSTTEASQIGLQILGVRYRDLLVPVLDVNQGIREGMEIQKKSGPVWDDITQNKLLAFDTMMDKVGRSWDTFLMKAKLAITYIGTYGVIGFDSWILAIYKCEVTIASWAITAVNAIIKVIEAFNKLPGVNIPLDSLKASLIGLTAQMMNAGIQAKLYEEKINDELKATQASEKAHKAGGLTLADFLKKLKAVTDETKDHTKELEAERKKLEELKNLKPAEIWKDIGNVLKDANAELDKHNAKIDKYELDLRTQLLPTAEQIVGGFVNIQGSIADTNKELDKFSDDIIHDMSRWKSEDDAWCAAWVKNNGTAVDSSKGFGNEVSTIFTNMVQQLADNIIEWKGWGATLLSTVKSLAKSLLSSFLEGLLKPLTKQMQEWGSTLGDWFGKLFSSEGSVGKNILSSFTSLFTGSQQMIGGTSTEDFVGPLQQGQTATGGSSWYGKAAGAGGGAYLVYQGMTTPGAKGWGETIAGGASVGTSIAPGIGTAIGAIAATAMKTIQAAFSGNWIAKTAMGIGSAGVLTLLQSMLGKSTSVAGQMEVKRDLGGVELPGGVFKSFYEALGLNEGESYGVRKDLYTSPQFLAQIAGPLAKEQGRMEEFLTSLEKVKTAWGTFNFRAAFELGESTGDWSDLNEQFQDAYEHSEQLAKVFPKWREELTMAEDPLLKAANDFAALSEADQKLFTGFTDLRGVMQMVSDSEKQLAADANNVYQAFFETGAMSDDFRKSLGDLGANMAAFETYSNVIGMANSFATARAEWEQDGTVMAGLSDIFVQAGINLSVLDNAALLPGLREGLSTLQSLAASIADAFADLIPKTLDPIQQFIEEGIISPELIASLANIIPDFATSGLYEQMQSMADLIQARNALSGDLTEEGQAALQSINDKLATLVPSVLTALNTAQTDAKTKIDQYTKDMTAALDIAAEYIKGTLATAREAVLSDLDIIIGKIGEVATVSENLSGTIADSITTGFGDAFSQVGEMVTQYWNNLIQGIGSAAGLVGTIGGNLVQSIGSEVAGYQQYLESIGATAAEYLQTVGSANGLSQFIPQYASGTDYVPRTGIYQLERGEAVIPAGENRGSVTVNIIGDITAYGLDDLDKKIALSIKRTFKLGGLSYLGATK